MQRQELSPPEWQTHPDFARDILEKGALDPKKVCMTCSKCTAIMRQLAATGCPIRDKLYLDQYRRVFAK